MRRPLSQAAKCLTEDVLCLEPHTLLARYVHLFFVFGLSGLLHMVAHIAGGMPLSKAAGALRFFVTQAVGIFLEDSCGALYKRSMPEDSLRGPHLLILEKIVGYAWVLLFLTWSAPVWVYNVASVPPQGTFLPFSIIKQRRLLLEMVEGKFL